MAKIKVQQISSNHADGIHILYLLDDKGRLWSKLITDEGIGPWELEGLPDEPQEDQTKEEAADE